MRRREGARQVEIRLLGPLGVFVDIHGPRSEDLDREQLIALLSQH